MKMVSCENEVRALLAEIDRLRQQVRDAESERDRCFDALQEIKRECGSTGINSGSSTVDGFIDLVLGRCPTEQTRVLIRGNDVD